MANIQFFKYKNFFLGSDNWDEAIPENLIKVLESAIDEFYSNLDQQRINDKEVQVHHSSTRNPPIDHPRTEDLGKFIVIYLASQNTLWSKYSYQFAHELCHYIADTNFYKKIDRFGWLEESICELASLFTLKKMSDAWATDPPYSNWKEYSTHLNSYSENYLNSEERKINIPFNEWRNQNLETLYNNRYDREKNNIIAMKLYPLFIETPELWKTIQYLKEIDVTEKMDLANFLEEWKLKLPEDLHEKFIKVQDLFS